MNARALWVACASAIVLTACGGGGGGDGGASSTAPAPIAPPQVSYPSPQVYAQNQAISPLVPTVTGTATSFSVSPPLPAGLTLNPATGAISGTPTAYAGDTDYTVTITGPGGSTSARLHLMVEPVVEVSRMVVAGTSVYPVVTLDATAAGLSGTLHASISDPDDMLAGPVTVTNLGGNYRLELPTRYTAPTGLHSGQATVSLCRDAACTTRQATPRLTVNYRVNVLAAGSAWPGNHLTALSPMAPGAPEWSTFQGNAAHTGYVPVTLDPNRANTRWQIVVPAFLYYNGNFNLATVTTEGGRFFIAGNNAVTARSEHDGSSLWSYSFAGLTYPSVNPPAVRNGTVYVAAGQQSSTYLFALNASDGTVQFRSAMSSQWEHYLAPTVGPSGIYTNAGTYGGLYAFNPQGTNLFTGYTAQQSSWTPAVDSSSVYAYTGDALRVFHPVTGALQTTIPDLTFQNYIYEVNGSAVLGAPNSVFAAAYANSLLNGGGIGNSLVHFNLQTNTADWTVRGVYPSTPAYDNGVLYAVNNNPLRLEARREADGALLWSWTPQLSGETKFVSEVLLTQNSVIVSTNQSTYAIDRDTHRTAWSYPAAGNLALSANGVLYIAGYTGWGAMSMPLTAINLR